MGAPFSELPVQINRSYVSRKIRLPRAFHVHFLDWINSKVTVVVTNYTDEKHKDVLANTRKTRMKVDTVADFRGAK